MMFRAGPDSPKPRRHLDAHLSHWITQRDDLHALALTNGEAFLQLSQQMDLCGQMKGREMQVWQPIMALAQLVEEAGAEGLLQMIQDHARNSIEQTSEETSPEADEVLLSLLAESIETHPQGITPSELLRKAKEQEPSFFDRWSPRGVSGVLNRYSQRTHRAGGKRKFKPNVTDLRRVESAYGLDLGLATGTTDTTDTEAVPTDVNKRHGLLSDVPVVPVPGRV